MSKQAKPGDRLNVGGVLCEAVAGIDVDNQRIRDFAAALDKPATVCGLCPAASAIMSPRTDLCNRTPCGGCLLVPVELVGPLKLAGAIRGEP